MRRTKDELMIAATVIGLRKGIVKASLLLGKSQDQEESHMLVTFINQAAQYIEKLKGPYAHKFVDIRLGSLVKDKRVVKMMKEKAGIETVPDLIASPLNDFQFSLKGRDVPPERKRKERISKTLYEVLTVMHSGAIGRKESKGEDA